MTVIRMRHARKAGLCSRGLRQFALKKGIDWDRFLEDGLDVEEAKLLDDAMAEKVISIAEEEEQNGK